jgi:peptidoglycan/LPS O-acetylase OafA/YrhL
VLWDSIWAFFFAANWHFAADGTNYWANDGLESPVQRYWSLAVEEQFYFVWPWVIILALGAGIVLGGKGKGTGRARTLLIVFMVIITAASYVWASKETADSPTWAYFSTLSRAWELGLGAVLAVIAPIFAKIPRLLRPVLGWLGLTGIVVAVFLLTDATAFPAPWALLPVLSTALVIAAGTGGEQRFLFPLTNRLSGYLGDISYSLYLWHWPVIVLVAALIPRDMIYYTIVLTLTLGLSVLSYHFVENPIRQSNWLGRRPTVDVLRRRRKRRYSPNAALKWAYAGLGVVVTGTLILVILALTPPLTPVSVSAPPTGSAQPTEASESTDSPVASDAQSVLSAEIFSVAHRLEFPYFCSHRRQLGHSGLDRAGEQRRLRKC